MPSFHWKNKHHVVFRVTQNSTNPCTHNRTSFCLLLLSSTISFWRLKLARSWASLPPHRRPCRSDTVHIYSSIGMYVYRYCLHSPSTVQTEKKRRKRYIAVGQYAGYSGRLLLWLNELKNGFESATIHQRPGFECLCTARVRVESIVVLFRYEVDAVWRVRPSPQSCRDAALSKQFRKFSLLLHN